MEYKSEEFYDRVPSVMPIVESYLQESTVNPGDMEFIKGGKPMKS